MNYQVISQIACPEKEGCGISVIVAYTSRDQKNSGNTYGLFLITNEKELHGIGHLSSLPSGNLLTTFLICAPRP